MRAADGRFGDGDEDFGRCEVRANDFEKVGEGRWENLEFRSEEGR